MWMRLLFISLCCFIAPAMSLAQEDHHDDHDHGHEIHHEHEAPHGGALVVFGDEFAHLEFVLDEDTGQLTAYALDGGAEYAVALEQPSITLRINADEGEAPRTLTLQAQENALTGEKVGNSSEFSRQVDWLKGVHHFEAVINEVGIKGQTFTGVEFSFPEGNE